MSDIERRMAIIEAEIALSRLRLRPMPDGHWSREKESEAHLRRMAASWKALAKRYRDESLALTRIIGPVPSSRSIAKFVASNPDPVPTMMQKIGRIIRR